MEHLKVFGLAVIAVTSALAFIGSGSAFATTACLNNESPCSEANATLIDHLLSSIEEGEFKSGFVTMKCHKLLQIHWLNGPELWRPAHLIFTMTGCKGCTGVTLTVTNAEFMATGGGNGVIKFNFTLTLTGCPFGVECKYAGESTEMVHDGSSTNAQGLIINQSLPKIGGSAFCSSSAVWNATFKGVTEEDRMLFVRGGPGPLCLVNESPCSESNTKDSLNILSTSGEDAFTSGFVTVKCDTAGAVVITDSVSLWIPVGLKLTYTNCKGCTSATSSINSSEVMATGSGNGVLQMTGVVTFQGCPFGVECKYAYEKVEMTFDGSSTNALGLVTEQSLPKTGGSAFCSASGAWTATFKGVSEADKMSFVI
jgi:hypothetical protein